MAFRNCDESGAEGADHGEQICRAAAPLFSCRPREIRRSSGLAQPRIETGGHSDPSSAGRRTHDDVTDIDVVRLLDAVAGAGIIFGMEESFRAWIHRGELLSFWRTLVRALPALSLLSEPQESGAQIARAVEHVRRRK